MQEIESLAHNPYLDTLKQKGCMGALGWNLDEFINLSLETCENAQTNKRGLGYELATNPFQQNSHDNVM